MKLFYWLFFTTISHAGAQTIIGVKAGIDISQFYQSDRAVESKIGMKAGLSTVHRITKVLALQLECLYVQKGSKIYEGIADSRSAYNLYRLHYIEFPFAVQISPPLRNEQLSLYTGAYVARMISSGIFSVTASGDEKRIGGVKLSYDYGFQAGLSYGVLGGLELDLCYSMGLSKVLTQPLSRRNKNWAIAIAYKFYRLT